MKKIDLLLSNALIVTQDAKRSILPESSIVISGNRIVAIGPSDQIDVQFDAEKNIDLRGKIIFPGLINTHDHLFQVATKGLGEDMAVQDWVTVVTAPTAAQQTPEEIYTVCLTGCLELIHSGVTSVIDMNYMAYTFGLHDENIHALVDSGLRSIYTSIISDYGLQYGIPEYLMRPTDWFIDQYEQLIKKYPPTDRLAVWVAIGAPWTVSGEGLDKALAFSKRTGTPMVMHIGENWVDNHCSLDRFGMNSVPYLEKIGFLRPELLAIHCVTLDDEDIELFRKYNVKVSYNPVSNMYLGNGIPQMMKMEAAGLRIGLGVDGAGSNNSQDMIETMKVAALLQKVAAKDASVVNAQQILDWATLGGAKILGLEDQIGSLEVGKQADLFVIAANSAKVVPIHDPVATLVYSCGQVKVAIDSPSRVLKPEMLVDVTFLAPHEEQDNTEVVEEMRIYVPRQFIQQDDTGTFVWVADQSARIARRVQVETGAAAHDGMTEIVGGLSITSRVIASGHEGLEDGDRIRIVGEESASAMAAVDHGHRSASHTPQGETK